MHHRQIRCTLPAAACARAESILLERGAYSVTFQDPGGEPVLEPDLGTSPLWEDVVVLALFDGDADLPRIRSGLEQALGAGAIEAWREETLPDQDWERAWMDSFAPMRFGSRLWVCPSTHPPPDAEAVNLKLDPGLAFGTGTHPTTALCLGWLDAQPLADTRVLDYGCGSGILAIAALLLGAPEAHGVDNDPQALVASRENAERNGVTDRLHLLRHDQPDPPVADLLVANILSGILIDMVPRLMALVRPGGRVALSGILEQQADTVIAAYASHVAFDAPRFQDGWTLLTGVRRDT
ncbi:50S ribosomal protein L11 methyltransferase [Aquisalimonas asiatica]|uniref:Ribosomal protein L11 methyltransferase n=1 Tax=Aquisalimonas asiatica TaxID=406100 RepID=A0A1H8TRN0_9GAMM|nr:50S ribosomal protein L11 methyltransferase [Aquisalimonas asiatica]SEO93662.1 ribosomal protein L11 methyltransferase [Aquisalimonas asiatica]